MNKTTFFISDGGNHSYLKDVAVQVFKALQSDEWEERQSANYPPDERYFAGYFKNATVMVCVCDLYEMSNYPFYIEVEDPTWRVGSDTMERDPVRIARLLVSTGLIVFIPNGEFWNHGWDGDGDLYTPKEKGS
jgi:hypothetical protein